jgi:hypothetical protein
VLREIANACLCERAVFVGSALFVAAPSSCYSSYILVLADLENRTALGEFVYHIVRLDWVMGYAPRWRVTIAPEFTSWRVDREQ